MTEPLNPIGSPPGPGRHDHDRMVPPENVAPGAYPIGVAPIAAAVGPAARPARRRPRVLAAAAVTGAMVLLPLSAPSAHARDRDRHAMRVAAAELELRRMSYERAADGTERSASPDRPERQRDDEEASPAPDEPTPIASVSGIRLVVPSMRTALVGFHEAAGSGPLGMASVAPLAANHNPGPMPKIGETQSDQVAPVIVLPTRARSQPPSTAIDIAVPAGEDILSPLDGTVTAVMPYSLYGTHPDVRVEIQPEGRPDLRVVMIHISDVVVEPGDELQAGKTAIAGSATSFPFESQIDRFTEAVAGEAMPHVHLEVHDVG